MATGARMERRGRHRDPEIRENYQQLPPRRRRWGVRLGLFFIILAVLAWFLPAIITNTPILGWALRKASGNYKGSISIQSASLGWLSPISIKGVTIRDDKNQAMVEVPEISSDKTLLAIIRNYAQLGQFRIDKPTISIVLRSDGSNAEDLLASFQSKTPAAKSSTKVAIDLAIADGTIKITDQAANQSWQLDKVNLNLNMPADDAQAMTMKATAEIENGPAKGDRPPDQRGQSPFAPGKLAAVVSMKSAGDDKSKDVGDISVQTENLPLAMAQSLAGRYLPQTKLDGRLNGRVHALWGGETAQGKTIVQLDTDADQFTFAAPAIGTDTVQLAQLRATGQITMSDKRIDIEKTTLDCDLGNFAITGCMNLDEKTKNSTFDQFLHHQYEIGGKLDIARLATMLPNTLHIRKQTQITSGQVQLALSSKQQTNADGQSAMVWQGKIETDNLVATDKGRQFAWQKPVTVALDAHDTAQGPVVDGLKCDSDFLKIHAAGTLDNLTASLSLNLKELGDQLGKFIDLGNVQLAGDGFGNLNFKRDEIHQFNADAELQLHNLQVVMPDKQPWREENLLVYCSAKGKTDGTADSRLDSASINIQAGNDRMTAQLLQPVTDLKNGGAWPVRLMLQGQLPSWTARLASFLPMADWRLAGTVDLDIQATGSKEGVNIGQAKIRATQFVMTSPYINLEEPQLELTAVGSWNQGQSRLQLAPATLATTSLSLQADNFLVAMPQNAPMEISGTVKYQGDLGRIKQWFADGKNPTAWTLGGQLAGSAQFKQSANMIQYEAAADINNLSMADSAGGKFQEPLIRISARGDYETKAGLIRLEQAQIASSFVAASAAGRYGKGDRSLSTGDLSPSQADINAQVSYDLDRICSLTRPYLGPNIRIVGRGSSPASWRGPLSLDSGMANAALKWDSANIYGFEVGPGEIKPVLSGGAVLIEPAELDVSQGKLFLAPKVRMSPQPMQLTLPPGPLVRQVQINPQMCGFFLKFIAPVLAEVTSAQGAFSIDLEGCRIPLSDPAKGELAGRFIIHSIEIGPGPLIRELAVLMGRESPAKLKREGVVPFKMVDGRVYHQDLELIFPDFTVRTYGSVGFDKTLAIMAEMPVPPKWLENNPLAPGLRDQTIRIPIAGTLEKPQLDRNVMEQLSRQFIRSAAQNLLKDGLNKGLDQFFQK